MCKISAIRTALTCFLLGILPGISSLPNTSAAQSPLQLQITVDVAKIVEIVEGWLRAAKSPDKNAVAKLAIAMVDLAAAKRVFASHLDERALLLEQTVRLYDNDDDKVSIKGRSKRQANSIETDINLNLLRRDIEEINTGLSELETILSKIDPQWSMRNLKERRFIAELIRVKSMSAEAVGGVLIIGNGMTGTEMDIQGSRAAARSFRTHAQTLDDGADRLAALVD